MQPVFKNIDMTRGDIGPFMRRYTEEHEILKRPQRSLLGSCRGETILLATPLLKWYMEHGLVVTRVYQVIEYDPKACFRDFGDSEFEARRAGDAYPDQAIIADTMKLSGNTGCVAVSTISVIFVVFADFYHFLLLKPSRQL